MGRDEAGVTLPPLGILNKRMLQRIKESAMHTAPITIPSVVSFLLLPLERAIIKIMIPRISMAPVSYTHLEEPNQFVAIHPNLIIVDAGEIKSSVIWYCSWENAGASNCTMVLDDATGKMLSFQLYKIYSDGTVPEDFGVFQETAERWLDFCRSYYGNNDISMTKDMYRCV